MYEVKLKNKKSVPDPEFAWSSLQLRHNTPLTGDYFDCTVKRLSFME